MKIFFVRHQAGNVLWEFPFFAHPSEAQLREMQRIAADRHGERHPKTDEPYWTRVVEVDVLNADQLPAVPTREPRGVPGGRVGEKPVQLSGVASVQNPKE